MSPVTVMTSLPVTVMFPHGLMIFLTFKMFLSIEMVPPSVLMTSALTPCTDMSLFKIQIQTGRYYRGRNKAVVCPQKKGGQELKPEMEWDHMSLCQLGRMGKLLPAVSVTSLTTDWPADWDDWEEAVWLTLAALTLCGQQQWAAGFSLHGGGMCVLHVCIVGVLTREQICTEMCVRKQI